MPESARGVLFNVHVFAAYCRVSSAGHWGVHMSVELSQAELVRQWFTPIPDGGAGAEGADVADRLSMRNDIQRVGDLLSELWFSADYAWTQWSDADVLAVLRQWLPAGTGDEAEFGRYAIAGQLASFIGWLDRAIPRWQGEEAQATAERGIENPDYAHNPITGTRFYRWAADRGEYLYSDEQDAPYVPGGEAWRSIDDRIAAQDPAQPHYDPGTDRWRRAAGGVYEYQHRDDLEWERTDGTSWLRKHSDAAGWLPYDKNSDTWFHEDRWRAHHEVAEASASAAPGLVPASRVIPVHQIPGWEQLEGEPWAAGWYALPGAEHYSYLYSPGAVPTEDTPGWTDVPPAPPLDYVGQARAGEAGAGDARAGGQEAEQDPQLAQTREQAQQLIIEPVMATLRRDQPELFEQYAPEDIEAMVWEQLGQLT